MKRSWLIVLLLLSLGVNIGVLTMVAFAPEESGKRWDRSHRSDRGRDHGRTERMADRLQLDGEPRQQFLEIQASFFSSFEELRSQLAAVREALHEEVAQSELDQRRVDELLAASSRLTGELDRLFVENVAASREVLDETQEQAYFKMLDRMREHRFRGDSRGRGRRVPRPADGGR